MPAPPITIDANGIPRIAETSCKVETVVLEHLVYGQSAEEISRSHFGEVSGDQVRDALAYYFCNREAMDAMIVANDERVDELTRQHGEVVAARENAAEKMLGD